MVLSSKAYTFRRRPANDWRCPESIGPARKTPTPDIILINYLWEDTNETQNDNKKQGVIRILDFRNILLVNGISNPLLHMIL